MSSSKAVARNISKKVEGVKREVRIGRDHLFHQATSDMAEMCLEWLDSKHNLKYEELIHRSLVITTSTFLLSLNRIMHLTGARIYRAGRMSEEPTGISVTWSTKPLKTMIAVYRRRGSRNPSSQNHFLPSFNPNGRNEPRARPFLRNCPQFPLNACVPYVLHTTSLPHELKLDVVVTLR